MRKAERERDTSRESRERERERERESSTKRSKRGNVERMPLSVLYYTPWCLMPFACSSPRLIYFSDPNSIGYCYVLHEAATLLSPSFFLLSPDYLCCFLALCPLATLETRIAHLLSLYATYAPSFTDCERKKERKKGMIFNDVRTFCDYARF